MHLTPSPPSRRRRTPAQLIRLVTAHHEAGHCVVAVVLQGPRPKAVTIEPDPGNAALLGRSDIDLGFVDTVQLVLASPPATMTPAAWVPVVQRIANKYAQISLAGTIASRRVARHSPAAHWETFYQNPDQGDWGVCQRVLRPFVSSKAELWSEVHRLRRATQVLVRQPRVWTAITHLAEALVRTSTLEGEELDLVLGGVQRILEGNALA